jgi:hypothetical protein
MENIIKTERKSAPPQLNLREVQRLIGGIMKDEIKRFKAAEIKESLYSILWVTIAAVIILGLSIFAKNATAIFFTVFIYFLLLSLAIKGYFEMADEIESRVLIKELLKEGQVKISLNYLGSEEISVAWIKGEELYSATLHNGKYPITYRQQINDKEYIVDRRIEIDDNLTVTVIG